MSKLSNAIDWVQRAYAGAKRGAKYARTLFSLIPVDKGSAALGFGGGAAAAGIFFGGLGDGILAVSAGLLGWYLRNPETFKKLIVGSDPPAA